jgi:small-conductance mechanosensitive channel
VVYFNRFGDFSLNLEVIYWYRNTDWKAYTKVFQALNLELKERFDAEGLNFAFPTQTLYMNPIVTGAPTTAAPSDTPPTTR